MNPAAVLRAPARALRAARDRAVTGAGRLAPRARRRVRVAIVAMLVVAVLAAVLVGWARDNDRRAEAQAWAVLAVAKARTEQLLSYDVATLDADLARARHQLTGDYAAEYEQTATRLIEPTTRAEGIVTVATVMRAALVRVGSDEVETLLFVNQATSTRAHPEPTPMTSQVTVVLSRVGDQWLISRLRPL